MPGVLSHQMEHVRLEPSGVPVPLVRVEDASHTLAECVFLRSHPKHPPPRLFLPTPTLRLPVTLGGGGEGSFCRKKRDRNGAKIVGWAQFLRTE